MKPTILEFVVTDQPTTADRDAILTPLIAFNVGQAGPSGFKELAILLRDPSSSETVGGLSGKFLYDWLFIELMFVPQMVRGMGLGSQLLKGLRKSPLSADAWVSGLTRSASRRAASTNETVTMYSERSTSTRAERSGFFCAKF